MDLFELVGRLAIEGVDKAKQDLDGVAAAGEKTQGRLSKFFSGVGKAGLAVGKAVGTGLAVAGTAIGGLTIKALGMAGSLEQNMGGSEAVFAEYAGKMQETAKNAFSNMGLSTNDFLATANKMGALFQGAGFSIEESSDLAANAMQRAADVASIMGIDTNAAMEAIAGAAKGNFEMMDNLGVAMNDTTLQNYALSKGIEKSTQEMTQQEKIALAMEMFMEKTAYAAGNYAKENETLAGALGTAKSALTNFLDGSGDVDQLVGALSNAANVIVNNLTTLAPRLVGGLTQLVNQIMPMVPPLLNQLLPVIVEGAVGLINGLVTALPGILSALMSAIPALIQGMQTIINALIAALPQLMQSFMAYLPQLVPMLINAVLSMIMALVAVLPSLIQPIINYLPALIIGIVNALLNNLPGLIQGLITLVLGIVQALPEIVQRLIDAIPQVVAMIVTALLGNLPALIEGFVQLVFGLVQALPQIFASLKQALPNVFMGIWNGVKNVFSDAGNWFGKTFGKAKDAAQNAFKNVGGFFKNIWSGIKNAFGSVSSWFKDTFSKAWSAVKDVFSKGGKIFDGIKEGIASTFKTIVNGLIGGINKVIAVPFKAINNALSKIRNVEIVGIKPFDWIKTFSIPQIPKLATGGVLKQGQVGLLEGSGAEAVVPLEKNTGWINEIAKRIVSFILGGTVSPGTDFGTGRGNNTPMAFNANRGEYTAYYGDEINNKLDRISTLLEQFFPQMLAAFLDQTMVLEDGTLVAKLAPKMDVELGKIAIRKGRGR